jgi:SPP1 family predicted phage head-tail adaptor
MMRQRLTLQQESRVADGGGGADLNWVDEKVLWAALKPLSGRETVQGEKLTVAATHRIVLRHDPAVTAEKRFLFGARIFNIRHVRSLDERGRFMEALAEEGVAV